MFCCLSRSCIFLVTFPLFFGENFTADSHSMKNYRHKRFTEIDICYETNNSLEFVNQCPDTEILFQERSRRKNCESYPQCIGEPLVYHCVRFREELVEVCAPRGLITDSKCVESKRKTPTLGRYERHTTLADKSNSIGTSKAWNSQRSSFAEEYHPVKLYETPVTISFAINGGEDIQQKRKLRRGHFAFIAFSTIVLLVFIIWLSVLIKKRYRKYVTQCSSSPTENWI
nr:uncharacterized protein LOC117686037 isoform X3 [Crassostrea gigas]